MLSSLRSAEIKVWEMAVADARELARRGDVWAGYECLTVGLFRAEEFLSEGADWAEELVTLYEKTLGDFTQNFGCGRH
jgi:hypothetical protein